MALALNIDSSAPDPATRDKCAPVCTVQPPAPNTRRAALAVILIVLGGYFLSASFQIDTVDTAIRLNVARSIAHEGTTAISPLNIPTPYGRVGGFPGADGRSYSVYGLGHSLLMVPFTWAGPDWDATLVTTINPLACALTCALLMLIAVRLGYSLRAGVRLGLIIGFCTLLWPQGLLTFEAPIQACLVMLAIYSLLGHTRSGLIVAGAAFGFAFLMRSTAVCMLPALAILFFTERRRWRYAPLAAAPALAFAIVALAYNAARWGNILGSGYDQTEFRYFSFALDGFLGLTISPGRGFFWYSPILLLAPFGFRRLARVHRGLTWGLATLVLVYGGFLSFVTVWHGDWTYGPRHTLVLVPALALGLLPFLDRPRLRPGLVSAAVLSGALQIGGVFMDYSSYFHVVWPSGSETKHHFRVSQAQQLLQAQWAVRDLTSLPSTFHRFGPDGMCRGERPALIGGEDIFDDVVAKLQKRGPPCHGPLLKVWWFRFAIAEISGGVITGLFALFLGMVFAGVWMLRSA